MSMTIRPVRFCPSDTTCDTLPARKVVQIDGLHIAVIHNRVRLDALVNEGTIFCRFLITQSSAIPFIGTSGHQTILSFHFCY